MSPSSLHPKWWQLYLSFPLLIALFALDSRLRISTRGHEAVQLGIVMLIYSLIHLWLRANRTALSQGDQQQLITIYRVIEIHPSDSPEMGNGSKSILQIPESEIHGLLGDGTDFGITDADFVSNKELRKN